MNEHTQAPEDYLSARDALLEAARLNYKAIQLEDEGSQCMAAWVADVSRSLSIYALALSTRNLEAMEAGL
jgi:hypothetical protein